MGVNSYSITERDGSKKRVGTRQRPRRIRRGVDIPPPPPPPPFERRKRGEEPSPTRGQALSVNKKNKKEHPGRKHNQGPSVPTATSDHHHRSLCLSLCPSLFLDFHSSRPLSRVEAWKSLFGWGHRVWVALARLIKTVLFQSALSSAYFCPPYPWIFLSADQSKREPKWQLCRHSTC